MAKSFHLYKLFYDSDFKIGISVPKSIIKGFGFEEVTYMTSDSGSLKFAEISQEDINDLIKIWKRSDEDSALIKQNHTSARYTSKTLLSDAFVIQEYIKNSTEISAVWTSEGIKLSKILSSVGKESNIKRTIEVIKMIIDKEVQTVHCKLTHLDITFLITDTTNYCLGINAYGYTPIVVTRMLQPLISNKESEKNNKKKSQVVLMKNRLMIKDKIDYAIEEITRQQESIRNITYKSWIDKVTKGEKLYPNEELFAKKIAKNAQHKNTAKYLEDLKLLTAQMQVSLSEKNIQARLNEGIRRTIENELKGRRKLYMIQKPSQTQPKSMALQEISALSARNLLKNSIKNLSYLSKRIV